MTSKEFPQKTKAFRPTYFALLLGLSFYATSLSLMPKDIVFANSLPAASLIELYSSEGCSSCPPAEAWVNDLKNAPGLWKDVFPVVFHVDYWDGLGWPDRFARAAYTQRQRTYAGRLGQDSVYTPEFVVNGLEWKGWFGERVLPATGARKAGSLRLTFAQDGKISCLYEPATSTAAQPLMLNVVLLGFNVTTEVKRGENAGRTLEHDFVALAFRTAPLAPGADKSLHSGPIEIKSSTNDTPGGLVAWVSQSDGTILQVTGGWLPSSEPSSN